MTPDIFRSSGLSQRVVHTESRRRSRSFGLGQVEIKEWNTPTPARGRRSVGNPAAALVNGPTGRAFSAASIRRPTVTSQTKRRCRARTVWPTKGRNSGNGQFRALGKLYRRTASSPNTDADPKPRSAPLIFYKNVAGGSRCGRQLVGSADPKTGAITSSTPHAARSHGQCRPKNTLLACIRSNIIVHRSGHEDDRYKRRPPSPSAPPRDRQIRHLYSDSLAATRKFDTKTASS